MFKTPDLPKVPPPPVRLDDKSAAEADIFRRKQRSKSGVASTFLMGSSGEPGSVGKLGLTGTLL